MFIKTKGPLIKRGPQELGMADVHIGSGESAASTTLRENEHIAISSGVRDRFPLRDVFYRVCDGLELGKFVPPSKVGLIKPDVAIGIKHGFRARRSEGDSRWADESGTKRGTRSDWNGLPCENGDGRIPGATDLLAKRGTNEVQTPSFPHAGILRSVERETWSNEQKQQHDSFHPSLLFGKQLII